MICFKNPPKNDFTTNLKHPNKIIFCFFGKGLFEQKYLQPHPFSTCHEIHEKWNWGTNCALLLLHMYIGISTIQQYMNSCCSHFLMLVICTPVTRAQWTKLVPKRGKIEKFPEVFYHLKSTTSENQIVFNLLIAGWYFCSFYS